MADAGTTTYRVETVYSVKEEKAVDGIHKIESAAHSAHSATGLLTHGLSLLGLGLGVHEAKHALIGFNEEMQNTKIGLSAMLQQGYGATFDQANAGAATMLKTYQQMSQELPITTSELAAFGNAVTIGTIQAGGRIDDITNIAKMGSAAAKVFGKDTIATSQAITEMLMGNARKQNGTVQLMLGMAHTEAKAFNALSASKRLGVVEKVLNSQGMKDAVGQMSSSFAGVTSTMEDKLQLLFGKIGLPLFNAITREVSGWNDWLDKNVDKVDAFAKTVGTSLVHGFEMIRDAFAFIAAHADTLITVAKVYAAIKIGSGVGGWAGGMINGAAGMAGGGGIGAAGGKLGMAFGGGYAIGSMINEKLGISDLLSGAKEVNGELIDTGHSWMDTMAGTTKAMSAMDDRHGYATAQLVGHYVTQMHAMTAMDDAVDSATKRLGNLAGTPGGTHAAANLAGMTAYARSDAAMKDDDYIRGARRALAAQYDTAWGSADGKGGTENRKLTPQQGYANSGAARDDPSLRFDQKVWAGHMDQNMTSKGFVEKGMADSDVLSRYADMLQNRNSMAQAETAAAMVAVMASLPNAAREMVDKAAVANSIMQDAMNSLTNGTAFDIQGIIKRVTNDPTMKAFDKNAGKGDTHITNNVRVEMSAKDPDRWMAELDSEISKQTRAPTSAKGRGANYTAGNGRSK